LYCSDFTSAVIAGQSQICSVPDCVCNCSAIAAVPTLTVSEVGDRWVMVRWVTGDDRYAPVRNFTLQMRRGSFAFTSAADYVPSALRNFTVVKYVCMSPLV